jgi:DNA-binding response OmpR family regulator
MISQPPRSKFPICLAMGDPVLASRLELILTDEGYGLRTFTSAKQLWENFATWRPRFIITEGIFKDGFSALDLCRAIRQDYLLPYVYIYIISRRNQMAEIVEALDAGANDYSSKPVGTLQVRARVLVGLRWLAYIDSLNPQSS